MKSLETSKLREKHMSPMLLIKSQTQTERQKWKRFASLKQIKESHEILRRENTNNKVCFGTDQKRASSVMNSQETLIELRDNVNH